MSEHPQNPRERKRRKKSRPPEKIGKLSFRLLEDLRNVQAAPTLILSSRWEDIAGADLANHARLNKLDSSGILHIVAENPSWATKIRWQSAKIQSQAAKFLEFGQIKGVKITVRKGKF